MSLRLFGRVAQSAPTGYLSNGFPIYCIKGAEGEGNQGNGNSGNSNAGTGTNDGGNTGTGASGDGKPKDGEDGKDGDGEKADPAELKSALSRMKAADKRAAEAEKKLADLAKKDMDEKTRAETERDEAKKAVETATERLKKQAIQIEFLGNTKYEWNNPKAALRLLDLDDVEIDDEGNVTGLDKAVKALADSEPYLLKPKDGTEQGKNGNGKAPAGKSGSSPKSGGTQNSKSDAEKRAELEAKHPSLRGRVSNIF
jgi:hypothetical protein